jgi:hypothetical protein
MIRIIMAVVAVIALVTFSVEFHNWHRRNLVRPVTDLQAWTWAQMPGASGGVSIDGDAMKFDLLKITPEIWRLQVFQRTVVLKEGQAYRVSFQAKASKQRTIVVGDGHPPVGSDLGTMGFNETPLLGTDWKPYEYTFTAHNVDGQTDKLPWFQLGSTDGTVWIKDVEVNEL